MGDIYDSAFRTIVNDCSKLMLPLINEAFGENYTGDEEITFFPNEHFINQQEDGEQKRITDTNFAVYGKERKTYHWEVQSTSDNRMLIRLFEYDAQIALDQGESKEETLTVEFPNSAVLYLRSTRSTPERYRYVIKTPGGTVHYEIPIMKIKSYTIDEIFEKKLLLLIPFYIFTFEADFAEYNASDDKLKALKTEYQTIIDRLNGLEKNNIIGEFDKITIIELADNVVKTLAARYENVLQGVDIIMSGPLIETKAKKIWNEGMQQGMKQGMQQGMQQGKIQGKLIAYFEMVKSGLITIKDASLKLGISESDILKQMAAMQS